jgi:hypothetical protein
VRGKALRPIYTLAQLTEQAEYIAQRHRKINFEDAKIEPHRVRTGAPEYVEFGAKTER